MRRRFRGNKKMPKIGYGSDNTTKFFLPNGLKKFVVHNAQDLNVLLMNNRTFCGEIAHNVSSRVTPSLISDQSRNREESAADQSQVDQLSRQGQNRGEEAGSMMWIYLNSKMYRQWTVIDIFNVEIIGTYHRFDHLPLPRRRGHHRLLHLRRHEEPAPGSRRQSTVLPPSFRVAVVSCIIGTISMWIMWACTYMHQMNPIIQPLLMTKK